MRVLFLAAEASPLVKVGGLGDVAGELPPALSRLGVDIRVAIPRYAHLAVHVAGLRPQVVVDVPRPSGPLPAEVYELPTESGQLWLVGGDPVERAPGVYGDPATDAGKFIFFSLGALRACRATGWSPDVVHAHDWHTAPALAWMRTVAADWAATASVLTVHNLPFMGSGGGSALGEYGLRAAQEPLLPEWARSLPLPLGMVHADWVTTVSPGYAAEIQTAAYGCGLESFLASRSERVRGILNGIDPAVWDPASDASLASNYDLHSLEKRRPNKAALQTALGLPVEPRIPLLGMVTRLDVQKGVDLALEALSRLPDMPLQFVLLGSGDPAIEDRARAFADLRSGHVRFVPAFDPDLSRRIYAGADLVLAPSRYEPCGLVQLIAMRYGAVPVVRATGGLKDTVNPYAVGGRGTGFLFGPAEAQALADAIREALGVYSDQRRWIGLQRRGMAQDFTWGRSARAYAELYLEAAAVRRTGLGRLTVISGRAGGLLLHPTSLPGPHGIGDLGPAAHAWVAWVASAGCRLWQVLPLGPTGYGDSPYQSFSAFAGNPMLISPDLLVQDGLLRSDELESGPVFPEDRVDFGAVIAWKDQLLTRMTNSFGARARRGQRDEFDQFRETNRAWLDDYSLFMALKRAQGGVSWTEWPEELRARRPEALTAARQSLRDEVDAQSIRQSVFSKQWNSLAEAAHASGIDLVGDVPIFVAHDSADVWRQPEMFALDASGQPAFVAGVPPDYFSPTGQRWGNPLYRWESMQADGYGWWLRRLQAVLSMVDIVRLDHFRGFEAYWEIPASAPTAETGRWTPGPGAGFLTMMRQGLGGLPIIAEDLGVITPGVKKLRKDFGLPGMKVLQFGFEGTPDDEFLPHNYPEHCVVYTGTHDNDTVVGWYGSAPEEARDFCRRYLARDGTEIAWDMIRAAWSSVAQWAIAPLQDVLKLGSQARMNYPSREHGNWGWRVRAEQMTEELAERLAALNRTYGRLEPATRPEAGG